jgi:hypothetical protein
MRTVCALFVSAALVACGERRDSATTPARVDASAIAPPPAAVGVAAASRPADPAVDATRALAIPARTHAAEAPPEGWCGETAIQEALLYLGVWAPQAIINRAGHPAHPDLYSNELPTALAALGVRFDAYRPRAPGFEAYAAWVREAIDAGEPVVAGVKILPTAHPEWGLDHFVLVVGYGERGLLVNTTWGYREWISDKTEKGISFKNAFYALRLHGVARPAAARPAQLAFLGETATDITLRVSCTGLDDGAAYAIERRTKPSDATPTATDQAVAAKGRVDLELHVPPATPARFVCTSAN